MQPSVLPARFSRMWGTFLMTFCLCYCYDFHFYWFLCLPMLLSKGQRGAFQNVKPHICGSMKTNPGDALAVLPPQSQGFIWDFAAECLSMCSLSFSSPHLSIPPSLFPLFPSLCCFLLFHPCVISIFLQQVCHPHSLLSAPDSKLNHQSSLQKTNSSFLLSYWLSSTPFLGSKFF